MMLALSLLLVASDVGAMTDRSDTLRCGTADLPLTSRTFTDPAASLAPARQTLSRRMGIRHVAVVLEPSHDVLVDDRRVADRYVASWACIKGHRNVAYVLIAYVCTMDPGSRDDCGGEKEWFRLLDQRGRFADAGVPHDGSARDRLTSASASAKPWQPG